MAQMAFDIKALGLVGGLADVVIGIKGGILEYFRCL